MRTILLRTTILKSGQQGRYGDHVYEYLIENESDINYDESFVFKYCQFLKPCEKTLLDIEDPFQAFYEFKKIEDRKYSYKVTERYTG